MLFVRKYYIIHPLNFFIVQLMFEQNKFQRTKDLRQKLAGELYPWVLHPPPPIGQLSSKLT